MIRVIQADDLRALEYSMFPEQNYANLQFIQNQMQDFANTLTESGRAFMETYRNIYAQIDHSEIARKARQAMRTVQGLYQPDAIVALETLESIQTAQLTMQRYVMAHPQLRALYHRNRADGYRDTYIDVEPGHVAEHHTDYRKVMTGAVIENEDGSWTARQMFTDLHDEDRPLDHFERIAIRKTWQAIDQAIKEGKDPSNIFGGDIGI